MNLEQLQCKKCSKFLPTYAAAVSHTHLDVLVSSHEALLAVKAVDAQCNFHFLVQQHTHLHSCLLRCNKNYKQNFTA
jgi:hypothetical protein